MPPRKPTEASTDSRLAAGPSTSVVDVSTGTVSANPDVEAPSTTIQGQDESILSVQDPDASTMEIDPPGGSSSSHIVPPGSDPPGPSTTFIPRQPSPPLPDLRSERFPPEFRPDGDDDSEDDEVIATLPIYLSPALHPHLHLFQFPLHTKSLVAPSYARDRGKGITARVKEKAGKLEVEVPVDAGVDVWRDDRARELGMTHDIGNGDGDVIGGYGFGGRGDDEREAASSRKKGKSKSKEDKRWGDTVRLRSEGIPSATGYYAGVVQDGALHLHPLSKIMQMRTALNYLDDYDERNRSRRSRANGADDEEDHKDTKPKPGAASQAQPPPVRMLRKPDEEEGDGSGSIKDFRNKMWRLANEEAEDTWVPYEWREGEDEHVVSALSKLIIADDKKERLKCTTKGLDYLDKVQ